MTRTVLILLPEASGTWAPAPARAAFECWWQGATSVAVGETVAGLPVPVERVFRSVPLLQLWLLWRRFEHVVVAGPGAAALADRLSAQRVTALPLRIA